MAWLVAFIGSLAGFLFGYDEGIIAGSMAFVKEDFSLTPGYIGAVASALPFGALFGSILIAYLLVTQLSKKMGRRALISLVGVLFFFGAVGAGYAESTSFLIASRIILGIAIGVAAVVTPLYLAEAAAAHLRGAVVAIYQLAITMGIVAAYSVNYALLGQHAWRLMFASSAIPAAILTVAILYLPESPRWLCSVGKNKEALKALIRLRKTENVSRELDDIKKTLSNEPGQSSWTFLFRKPLMAVLLIGVCLSSLQQLSGINVIIYYAPEIFKNLGMGSVVSQVMATMGIGIVNMLVTVLALFYVDKIGRRKLLIFGFAGTCISLLSLSIISLYQVPALATLSVVCLTVYIFSFAISLGPVPFIAISEMFPLHVRGAGIGLSLGCNWFFNTLLVFSFPVFISKIGIEYTFAVYALVCFIGLLFSYYFMPETKNLSLESIENYLMAGKPIGQLGREREMTQGHSTGIEATSS